MTGYLSIDLRLHTCVEVPISEGLQDTVHGTHVEEEAELRHAHGDQAEQEDGSGDGFQEGLGCGGTDRSTGRV